MHSNFEELRRSECLRDVPKSAQDASKTLPSRSRNLPKCPQDRPLQENSKPPRAADRASRSIQDGTRTAYNTSKTLLRRCQTLPPRWPKNFVQILAKSSASSLQVLKVSSAPEICVSTEAERNDRLAKLVHWSSRARPSGRRPY